MFVDMKRFFVSIRIFLSTVVEVNTLQVDVHGCFKYECLTVNSFIELEIICVAIIMIEYQDDFILKIEYRRINSKTFLKDYEFEQRKRAMN
jgi:hypothetical protein